MKKKVKTVKGLKGGSVEAAAGKAKQWPMADGKWQKQGAGGEAAGGSAGGGVGVSARPLPVSLQTLLLPYTRCNG